jgi:hypothetical protein
MRKRIHPAIPLLGCSLVAMTAWASSLSTNSTSTATVDLRDGSRLVGQLEQDTLQFQSDLMGEFRVPVGRVRSIQWPNPDQALARLKVVNGDEFLVKLKTPELRLKTSFGEVKLRTALMKQVQVSTPGEPGDLRRGLIALWSGEDNARDSVKGHNGKMLFGADFAEGKVGRAFHFATPSGRVHIPDSEDFVINGSFTAAGWVYISKFPSEGGLGIICMRGDNRPSLDTWSFTTLPDQQVGFSITSEEDESATVMVPTRQDQWLHIVGVFDSEAGRIALYIDGRLAAEKETTLKPIWRLDRSLEAGIGLGGTQGTFHTWPFQGMLDEWALYARALPESDIRALVDLGSAGERILPPSPVSEKKARPAHSTERYRWGGICFGAHRPYAPSGSKGDASPACQWGRLKLYRDL